MGRLIRIGSGGIAPRDGMHGQVSFFRGDGTHYVRGDIFPRDNTTNLTSYLSAQFVGQAGLRIGLSLSLTPMSPRSTGGRVVYFDRPDGHYKLLGRTVFLRYAIDEYGVTDATFHPTAPLVTHRWIPVDLDTPVPMIFLSPGDSVPFIEDSKSLVSAPLHTRVLVEALSLLRPFEGGGPVQDVLRTAGASWVHDAVGRIQSGYQAGI